MFFENRFHLIKAVNGRLEMTKCDVGVLLLDLEEQGFKLVVYAGNAFDVLMRKSQCFKIDDMQFFLDRS